MPRAVSLFSGCGGSDLGLRNLGFDVVMANDILKSAMDVHTANFPETHFVHGNVAEISSFPSADLLVGCYPCQGYSQGGARESSAQINYLFIEFARALRQIKPPAFIIENVSGLLRSDNRALFERQIRNFRQAGYRVKWQVLNANDFGIAQSRKRIFIVGVRSDIEFNFGFPNALKSGIRHHAATIQDAIGHLPLWPEGEYYDVPFHWYYMSRNRRRSWNEPAPTIVSNARHIPLHPVSPNLVKVGVDEFAFETDEPARRFSYREAALLQGFPEDFVFPEQLALMQKYKVIGNAVPPPLFQAVAKELLVICGS